MDKNYNHLEFEERMLIGALLGAGLSIRSIALGVGGNSVPDEPPAKQRNTSCNPSTTSMWEED